MKKILILGSLGTLGQELVRVFRAFENYEVVAWDKEEIDITSEVQVKEKIGILTPEIIINAAAYNVVDKCEEPAEFKKAKLLNGYAPSFLAQAAKKLGAIFVHYGTDYVFDGQKIKGYREDDKPSPLSRYGQSKLLGEQNVQRVDGRFYIIRLQRLFGRPAKTEGAKKSFFEIMIALIKTKKELEVVNEELANFTYAPDLADRTKYIIEENLPFGIYHVTNEGQPVTWFGAAVILLDLIRNSEFRIGSEIIDYDAIKLTPVLAEKISRPAIRPKYSVLLNTKLAPLRPWPKALKEFLSKFKNQDE